MMRDEYPDTKTLAKSLRSKREKQQLSRQDLAAISGVPLKTLAKIENGATSPTVETLYALSFALEYPIENMLRYNKSDFCSMVKQREYTMLTISDVINHIERWDYSQGLPKGDYLYGTPSCFDEAANGKRFHCFTSKSFKTDHVEGEVFFSSRRDNKIF